MAPSQWLGNKLQANQSGKHPNKGKGKELGAELIIMAH